MRIETQTFAHYQIDENLRRALNELNEALPGCRVRASHLITNARQQIAATIAALLEAANSKAA